MRRIFQGFIDSLIESNDAMALRAAMAETATALDLRSFAYLTVRDPDSDPDLISTYPADWTSHYLEQRYERIDPVIRRARQNPEPFEWGTEAGTLEISGPEGAFFEEAAAFGIRCGYTIPIHDGTRTVAAVTFSASERHSAFRRSIEMHGPVLQLIAVCFHAHARWKTASHRLIDGVRLSPRELECLRWAAEGKSALDTATILGIRRRTVLFHLENAKTKLGVRSICQAVARLGAHGLAVH